VKSYICERCGKKFTSYRAYGQKYCSWSCFRENSREDPDMTTSKRKKRSRSHPELDLVPAKPVSMKSINEKYAPYKYLLD